jgi:hypothetical protein
MGHAQNSVGDRYRHRLRGQLAEDAQRLEEYLRGDAAKVVPAPDWRADWRAGGSGRFAKRNWLSLQTSAVV